MLQVSIYPALGAFVQVGRDKWAAPLNADHREPWFRYLGMEAPYLRDLGIAPSHEFACAVRDLPAHLQAQALRIWRTYNPASVAALFRRCAPDYSPSNDPWGHCMAVHFDVAAWLAIETGEHVRGYRPGAGGPECECVYIAKELERAGVAMARRLARFCGRVSRMLERAGRSY